VVKEQDHPKCVAPDCPSPGGLDDRCAKHRYQAHAQRTSDGRMTGGEFKLTDEEIAEARRMRAAFKTNREIATHFGVSPVTLQRALARKT
jgi:DNA invertase Pin-like site-specific DNA recombinase